MDHSAVQLSGNAERRAWTAPTNSVDALPSMGDGAGLPPPFPDAVIRSLAPPGVGLGDLGLAEQMHAGHLLFLMCPAAQTIRMARPRGRNHAGTRANDGAKPRCQRLFSPCTHIRLNHPDGDGEDFFSRDTRAGCHRIASHCLASDAPSTSNIESVHIRQPEGPSSPHSQIQRPKLHSRYDTAHVSPFRQAELRITRLVPIGACDATAAHHACSGPGQF